jgi:hypothetical protein
MRGRYGVHFLLANGLDPRTRPASHRKTQVYPQPHQNSCLPSMQGGSCAVAKGRQAIAEA